MNVWMKAGLRAGAVIVVTAAIAGCAGVDFYSDPGLTAKTGIPIYRPKPYVLVSRTKNKDKPVEVSIQYLPDYSAGVIYAKPRSGFGSADLKLTLANGQLTQFGQVTDTKVPELIAAVSGLLTSRATAEKTLAEAKVTGSTAHAAKVPDAKTISAIKGLHHDMSTNEAKADLSKLDQSGEQSVIQDVLQSLANILNANDNPSLTGLLPQYADQLIAAAKNFANLPEEAAASGAKSPALQRIRDWKPRLKNIVEQITPDEDTGSAAPDFELYEINQAPSGVILHRVQ